MPQDDNSCAVSGPTLVNKRVFTAQNKGMHEDTCQKRTSKRAVIDEEVFLEMTT